MSDPDDCTLLYLKERMDLKFEAIEHARSIQFNEFMRRLEDLNGEAERLRVMQASYVPREVDAERSRQIDASLERLEAFRNNVIGRMAALAILVSVVSSAATAIVVKVLFQ